MTGGTEIFVFSTAPSQAAVLRSPGFSFTGAEWPEREADCFNLVPRLTNELYLHSTIRFRGVMFKRRENSVPFINCNSGPEHSK